MPNVVVMDSIPREDQFMLEAKSKIKIVFETGKIEKNPKINRTGEVKE